MYTKFYRVEKLRFFFPSQEICDFGGTLNIKILDNLFTKLEEETKRRRCVL